MGVGAETFWRLTPYQFKLCVEAYSEKKDEDHDHAMWIAYHQAFFQRSAKMPKLKDYLSGAKKRVKTVDERAIMAGLKTYQKRRQGNGTGSPTIS